MFSDIQLNTSDNNQLSAYLAEPLAEPKGGVVILHEIFGVTENMRYQARNLAEFGYKAIVPALFDRAVPNSIFSYNEPEKGQQLVKRCSPEQVLLDIQAAIEAAQVNGKVAVVGYCWGGTYAYLSACRLKISAAVAFYGTRIIQQLEKQPRCPVQFHFGKLDSKISPDDVEKIEAANPNQPFYTYDNAGHGFACADRTGFEPKSAALAEERTFAFLDQMLISL